MIENKENTKISLATVHNTVHAFNKKGYLKEIAINSSHNYFDTNTSNHHHFFDVNENKRQIFNKYKNIDSFVYKTKGYYIYSNEKIL